MSIGSKDVEPNAEELADQAILQGAQRRLEARRRLAGIDPRSGCSLGPAWPPAVPSFGTMGGEELSHAARLRAEYGSVGVEPLPPKVAAVLDRIFKPGTGGSTP